VTELSALLPPSEQRAWAGMSSCSRVLPGPANGTPRLVLYFVDNGEATLVTNALALKMCEPHRVDRRANVATSRMAVHARCLSRNVQ
jgi:hypothetical protein